jgi:hypothetical protein
LVAVCAIVICVGGVVIHVLVRGIIVVIRLRGVVVRAVGVVIRIISWRTGQRARWACLSLDWAEVLSVVTWCWCQH